VITGTAQSAAMKTPGKPVSHTISSASTITNGGGDRHADGGFRLFDRHRMAQRVERSGGGGHQFSIPHALRISRAAAASADVV
jgi:hypothetical protein